MTERHTISGQVTVLEGEALASQEAENALLQFDRVLDLIDTSVRDGRPFRLRPSTILTLHAEAMRDIHPQAGTFRNAPVEIGGSKHAPPAAYLVPALVEDMCDAINDAWSSKSAIELCAYAMWRLNWIHPFADGNGRTSRAVAYLVLCVRAGARLPGTPSIPEQIAENKPPYYDALETADLSAVGNEVDLKGLTDLLNAYLTKQLAGLIVAATTSTDPSLNDRKFH